MVTKPQKLINTMSKAQEIKQRLRMVKAPFGANDNISSYLLPGDLEALQEELAVKMQSVLDALVIDTDNDHNSQDTAKRVAKMFINETYSGRYLPMPAITDFPNAKQLDEIYTVGPIHINSSCSHHMVPIIGDMWVAVHPGERVIGLSKFHRLARWIWRRGQIQEEGTIQTADLLESLLSPLGVAVVFKASHLCCSCRGVEDAATIMTTSVVRGSLRENASLKAEFFNLISFSTTK
jgi:GTP cyclohydrolase I